MSRLRGGGGRGERRPPARMDIDEAPDRARAKALRRELARRDAELARAREELAALLARRVVRAALWLAEPLVEVRRRLHARRWRAQPAPTAAGRLPAEDDAVATEIDLLYWPLDHPHSPVPDIRVLARERARSRIWPPKPDATPGIDWREEAQVGLVEDIVRTQEPLAFAEAPTEDPTEYHAANGAFSLHDAWALQGILRRARPRRMIEAGAGWSSLVAARVNREHLDGAMQLTCVDPSPPDYIAAGVDGISGVVDRPVEELPLEQFLELEAGDVLFIDSTHTVKTGGDVVFLYGQVLPRLAPGVLVQIHDVFLPTDYPEEWVLSGWAWNEQYLVQAFLAFNADFDVILSVPWLACLRPEVLDAVPGLPRSGPWSGASLWIRRGPALSTRS